MSDARKKPWLIGEHRQVFLPVNGSLTLVGYVRERINPRRQSMRYYQHRLHTALDWSPTRSESMDDAQAALLVAVAKHQQVVLSSSVPDNKPTTRRRKSR